MKILKKIKTWSLGYTLEYGIENENWCHPKGLLYYINLRKLFFSVIMYVIL